MARPKRGARGKAERAPPAVLRLHRVLHALSDPVRLAVVAQLGRNGESSCAALDGGRPKSSMSHHFRVLREAGVVHTEAHGNTHMNRLRHAALDAAFPGLLTAILAAAPGEAPEGGSDPRSDARAAGPAP